MELEPEQPEQGNPSEELDLVTVFSSDRHDAEMEALAVKGVLDAAGIFAVVAGSSVIPSLPFEVRVPRERLEEALRVIAESEAAGSRAAEEAERSTEESG